MPLINEPYPLHGTSGVQERGGQTTNSWKMLPEWLCSCNRWIAGVSVCSMSNSSSSKSRMPGHLDFSTKCKHRKSRLEHSKAKQCCCNCPLRQSPISSSVEWNGGGMHRPGRCLNWPSYCPAWAPASKAARQTTRLPVWKMNRRPVALASMGSGGVSGPCFHACVKCPHGKSWKRWLMTKALG